MIRTVSKGLLVLLATGSIGCSRSFPDDTYMDFVVLQTVSDSLTPGKIEMTYSDPLIVKEDGSTATISIKTNKAPGADVTLTITSKTTDECAVSPATMTFTSENWSTLQKLTISGVDDNDTDGDQSCTILVSTESQDLSFSGLADQELAVTNQDNDLPGIQVSTSGGLSTSESDSSTSSYQSFTLVLQTRPTSDVTISVSVSDTSEGSLLSPSSGSLTFTSGNWNTAQTVKVQGVDDGVVDGNIAYSVILGSAVSNDPDYNGKNPGDVSVTNQDNDAIGVEFTGASSISVKESGTNDSYFVRLTSQPTASVSLCLTVDDYCQATILTGSGNAITPTASCPGAVAQLDFTTSNYSTYQEVMVQGRHDADYTTVMSGTLPEGGNCDALSSYVGDSTFTISTTVSTTDSNYSGYTISGITGTIVDDKDKFSFSTAATHTGNFDNDNTLISGTYTATNSNGNGVEEADNFCMNNLPAALSSTGNYKAFLVDGTNRIACVNSNCSTSNTNDFKNWVMVKNSVYFQSDGKTRAFRTNSVDGRMVLNESAPVSNGWESGGVPQYWTGIKSDWTTGTICGSTWASTAGNGEAGWSSYTDYRSLDWSTALCTSTYSLICVQQ